MKSTILILITVSMMTHVFGLPIGTVPTIYPVPEPPIQIPGTVSIRNSTAQCKFCHVVADIIRKDANATNATIQSALKAAEDLVCFVSPPFICAECKVVVNASEAIINMITKGLSDQQICEQLHFCPKPSGLLMPRCTNHCDIRPSLTELPPGFDGWADMNCICR